MPKRADDRTPPGFAYQVLIATLIVAAVAFVIVVLWRFATVLLLIFAAILLAVLLSALADLTAERLRIKRGAAIAVVISITVLLFGGLVYLVAPSVSEQAAELRERLPQSWGRVEEQLRGSDWGQWILNQANGEMTPGAEVLARAPGIVSRTVWLFAMLFFILFVGIYLAVKPEPYVYGLLKLVPVRRRERVGEVLGAIGYILQWWLIGQAGIMLFVGVITGIGLAVLGVPLALTLAIIAALLEFIPNIGPIIAAIPAILVGFLQGPEQALYVAILYTVIQQVESYLVTPLVHRKTITLQPALTISAQIALSLTLGPLGLILATPLTATALVATKMLYVEDVLGDEPELEVPGEAQTIDPSQKPAA